MDSKKLEEKSNDSSVAVFTDICDDAIGLLLDYLEIPDQYSLSRTNKYFYTLLCRVGFCDFGTTRLLISTFEKGRIKSTIVKEMLKKLLPLPYVIHMKMNPITPIMDDHHGTDHIGASMFFRSNKTMEQICTAFNKSTKKIGVHIDVDCFMGAKEFNILSKTNIEKFKAAGIDIFKILPKENLISENDEDYDPYNQDSLAKGGGEYYCRSSDYLIKKSGSLKFGFNVRCEGYCILFFEIAKLSMCDFRYERKVLRRFSRSDVDARMERCPEQRDYLTDSCFRYRENKPTFDPCVFQMNVKCELIKITGLDMLFDDD